MPEPLVLLVILHNLQTFQMPELPLACRISHAPKKSIAGSALRQSLYISIKNNHTCAWEQLILPMLDFLLHDKLMVGETIPSNCLEPLILPPGIRSLNLLDSFGRQ